MSLLPLWEDIEKLSPDPATLERCYRLASQRYLKDIGVAEGHIWGKIKTSGASFYQVCWQLDTFISASNSPIYPKPDKYTLALAFYYCKNPMAFPTFEEIPSWVITYVSKKPLSEAEILEKEAENQRLREKNQIKRQSEMLQGCLILTLWLEDCLKMGLARLREQPYSFWESIVSRLTDFKLNGIASRLLPLFYQRNDENWIQIAIKQLGEIILFCEAFQKWDDFTGENQQDLLVYGGATIKKEVVLSEPPVTDEWFVCSLDYKQISNDLNARFVWLFGRLTGRYAQVISYSWRGEKWEDEYELHTQVIGNVHYYPSGFPQRAILQINERKSGKIASFPTDYKDWHSFFESYRMAFKRNFLLEEFPGFISELTVMNEKSLILLDKSGTAIETVPDYDEKWDLVAFSENKKVTIFGLWNGLYFIPKSYF